MEAAALLVLLAALPGHAAEPATPAQARANVVQALPPDIARGAGNGDLRAYLERLSPEQKQAALRSLTEKEGELGDDPATLGVIGEAYAGLGRVSEAREAAQAILSRNPGDPAAKRLMVWVTGREKLPGREAGGGPPGGDVRRPAGGVAPAAAARQSPLNALEQRIARAFRRGQRSAEFQDTMQDARGLSVDELEAAGITFEDAKPDQKDAVRVTEDGGKFTIALRADALASGGDTEARTAAHVANGVRQAQTLRDHEFVGWFLVKARGWFSGATTHKELAPNDLDPRPTTPSDQNLMAARKVLDLKNDQFDREKESYGEDADEFLPMANSMSRRFGVAEIFERFMKITGRNEGA